MMDYKSCDDVELLGMLKASDRRAYTEIYNRYHYLLLNHAYKKLRDEELAKDVIQELFAGLWMRREQEINSANLAGYLYTITRNKILDIFAHQKVRSNYVENSLQDFALHNSYSNTDHLIREKEFMIYIEREIQALPKKMREIFELSRKGNLTHKEIAAKLNTSEHNVSKQISNAIRILRKKTDIFIIIYLLYGPF
jgi:RNA polymerase sigma-70 factor (family 1)